MEGVALWLPPGVQSNNVTPADAYFRRKYAGVSEREKIKKRTMRKRKKDYLAARAA